MARKFRVSGPARSTLYAIGNYTEKGWGKKQRRKYIQKFSYRFKYLADNPLLGIGCDHISPYMRSYPEGSHVIYYFVFDSYIEIVDILHKNMDVESHFDDLTKH